ncbi:nucleotidyl transferase AbiEii/AbiGii toxin family protein [Streptococcus mitis]|uniref:Abortive phage infection protein n=1 Tax=Streptococcus mitis TaxID=28037 RepID=A0A1X1KVM6_STRMT|nr:nucleotidyl transferase AbiEii/AbiGii toxin family protein [Streptococcus mitis]ORP03481.1 abortive phage infection protein [Streptococcus mitis]
MFSNANSFKAKIKNISKDKGIPAQQVQQHYLIEQVLKLISTSSYRDSFIVKGGYLIGQMIGLDKRTTMDLDVTLKGTEMSRENLIDIFEEILCSKTDGFSFSVDKLEPIRQDDEYGGFSLKLNAAFDTLKEVVFIDITTGDKITPREITYSMTSIFTNESIKIWTYNLETVLAEKLETIISRGLASTRPRDRYDLFTLYKLRKEEINLEVLKNALENTAEKRKSKETIYNWKEQVRGIEISDYQKELWIRYQRQFKYAKDISFDNSVQVIREIMQQIF